MREYDYILVYEHKVRELEALCLLKCELERRKHSVLILGLNSFEFYKSSNSICKKKYYAKVLGVFGCYNTNTLRMNVAQIVKFDKVINLQWEQMLAERRERGGTDHSISEIGKEVVHISWGHANRNRLVNDIGIAENKVFECGNMAFDFLSPDFDGYYYAKEEIHAFFDIPLNMKICTFFANFKGAGLNAEQLEQMGKQRGEDWIRTQKVAKQVKDISLEWLLRAAKEKNNIFFVYRPHPGEDTKRVEELIEKYDNIRVIRELSSKQWIKVSDYMFTWHSTVAIEAKFANKQCILLEPENCIVPKLEEAVIFQNAKGVTNYSEFIKTFDGIMIEDSLSQRQIESYFGKLGSKNSYVKVADAFEKVFSDDSYLLNEKINLYGVYEQENPRKRRGVFWAIDELVWGYLAICSVLKLKKKDKRMQEYQFIRKREKIECASKREIEKTCNKIKKVIGTKNYI